jgi:hypothetical protein
MRLPYDTGGGVAHGGGGAPALTSSSLASRLVEGASCALPPAAAWAIGGCGSGVPAAVVPASFCCSDMTCEGG